MLFGLGPARGRLPLGTIEVHTGGSSPGRSRTKIHLCLRAVPFEVGAPKDPKSSTLGLDAYRVKHVAFRARANSQCAPIHTVLIPHKES